jgi:hypothetical protein
MQGSIMSTRGRIFEADGEDNEELNLGRCACAVIAML